MGYRSGRPACRIIVVFLAVARTMPADSRSDAGMPSRKFDFGRPRGVVSAYVGRVRARAGSLVAVDMARSAVAWCKPIGSLRVGASGLSQSAFW